MCTYLPVYAVESASLCASPDVLHEARARCVAANPGHSRADNASMMHPTLGLDLNLGLDLGACIG